MNTKKQKFEIPEEWLREQYVTLGRSITDIAKEIGCSIQTIRVKMKDCEIESRPHKKEICENTLRKLIEDGLTTKEISKHFNCGSSRIFNAMVSCGITKININKKPKNNLLGLIFGALEVIEYSGRDKIKGDCIWKCKCECGKLYFGLENSLVTGNTKSCGCGKLGGYKNVANGKQLISPSHFRYLKSRNSLNRGNSRKLKFNITLEELGLLPHEKCKYCGDKLTFPKRSDDYLHGKFNASLDRIDSSLDIYNVANCQWICKPCNLMKLDWPEGFFLEHIRKMSEEYSRRKKEEEKGYMDGL